jgi:FKBP-type peptidyl-prolyl cis-trans isomerase
MNFKLMNAIMTIVVVSVLLFGCDGNEFKTSTDGYEFKYIKKGTGDLPKNGEIVVYNMKYIDEKDSLIFETDADQPAYVPFDSMQWSNMGPLYKAFKIIKEGDSILIKVPTKTLFEESFRAAVPPSLNPEGFVTFCIGASSIMTEEEMEMEAMAKSEKQMSADIEVIDQYLEQNNISAQSTDSGLRYVIDVEGTGNFPQPGDNVMVNYRGSLLDGIQFESTFETNEPFTFTIGQRQVIMGWDEGIALLKAGGKGTLYIPSPMAYGERGAGGIIPPNSVLKFDVELIQIN